MHETMVVDMEGAVIRISERVLAIGDTHAVVSFEDGLGLVDLVAHTIEPLRTLECSEGQRLAITHLSGNRFATSCLEFDRASVEGKEFGCGTAALRARRHTVRAQEVLDVQRATRFVVEDAVVEAALPHALIARAGGDLHLEDGGPVVVAFELTD